MAEKKRRRRRKPWVFEDFKAVLALPERLAEPLRLLLHLDDATWAFVLDRLRNGDAYREWSFSKGPGKGFRRIAAPCDELKEVQKAVYDRFLRTVQVHFARHGNQPSSSAITGARHHAGFARAVFSVDLMNAFPTVHRSRIRANLRLPFSLALRQFSDMRFSRADDETWDRYGQAKGDEKSMLLRRLLEKHDFDFMLEALVDLICLHDRLPQGPPTSPRVLDIVCLKLDEDIWKILHKHATPFQKYRYTAYADDLTISSNGEIPLELRDEVLAAIKSNGFFPHVRADKTKYMSPEAGEVPVVNGLVLNRDGRITVAPRKVDQFRARLHTLLQKDAWDDTESLQLTGILGYIRHIYPDRLPSTIRKQVMRAEARIGFAKLGRVAALKSELDKLEPPMPGEPPAVAAQAAAQGKRRKAKAVPEAEQPAGGKPAADPLALGSGSTSRRKPGRGKKSRMSDLVIEGMAEEAALEERLERVPEPPGDGQSMALGPTGSDGAE